MSYINEIRTFLKECDIYWKERIKKKVVYLTTPDYVIKYDQLVIKIFSPYGSLLFMSENINIFKITILFYELTSKRIRNLCNEVIELIHIYDRMNIQPYHFAFNNSGGYAYSNLVYLIRMKKIQPINWNPFEAIPHLKQKIDEMDDKLYEPDKGKEYFYLEQLYNSIIQNE